MSQSTGPPRIFDLRYGKSEGKGLTVEYPSVRITPETLQKLYAWILACPHEVGGFGLVEEDDDGFLITDVALVHQDAGAVETDIKPDDAAKFVEEVEIPARKAGRKGRWRMWWHSHVNMAAELSGQDTQTASSRVEYNDWYISIVMNKAGDVTVRLDIKQPRLVLTHVPLGVAYGKNEGLRTAAVGELETYIRPMQYAPVKVVSGGKVRKGWVSRLFALDQEELEQEEGVLPSKPGKPALQVTLAEYRQYQFETQRKIAAVWRAELFRLMDLHKLTPKEVVDEAKFQGGYTVLPGDLGNWRADMSQSKDPWGSDGEKIHPCLEAARRLIAGRAPKKEVEPLGGLSSYKEFEKLDTDGKKKAITEWVAEAAIAVRDHKLSLGGLLEQLESNLRPTIERILGQLEKKKYKPQPTDGPAVWEFVRLARWTVRVKELEPEIERVEKAYLAQYEQEKTLAERDALLDQWGEMIRVNFTAQPKICDDAFQFLTLTKAEHDRLIELLEGKCAGSKLFTKPATVANCLAVFEVLYMLAVVPSPLVGEGKGEGTAELLPSPLEGEGKGEGAVAPRLSATTYDQFKKLDTVAQQAVVNAWVDEFIELVEQWQLPLNEIAEFVGCELSDIALAIKNRRDGWTVSISWGKDRWKGLEFARRLAKQRERQLPSPLVGEGKGEGTEGPAKETSS